MPFVLQSHVKGHLCTFLRCSVLTHTISGNLLFIFLILSFIKIGSVCLQAWHTSWHTMAIVSKWEPEKPMRCTLQRESMLYALQI